jgi:hypothetical protein
MPFIGNTPAQVPLTSADIADGIITSAKIVDGTIVNADINASAAIVSTKLSGVQGKFESALLHVRDEKSSGTNGGTYTSGSFETRTLNTVMTNEISGASLSSNQITLPSGTYFIYARVSAFRVDRHKTKLRNVTDSSDTLIGSNAYTAEANVGNDSWIIGRFTIASSKAFAIENRCQSTRSDDGYGVGAGYSVVEVYTDVQIWKVA